MEHGSRSSRQNLTVEDVQLPPKKKSGYHLTTPTLLFIFAIFVAALIAVALVVWFAIPREKCKLASVTDRLESCRRYMKDKGRAAVCGTPPKVPEKKNDTEIADDTKKGLRLNKTVIPIHYDLEMWPRFYPGDDFTFTGNVTIQVTCREPTDVIVLQVDLLTVDEASIVLRNSSASILGVNGTSEDVPRHFFKIYPERRLVKNQNYSLSMSFNGTLIHDDWLGFYRSSYMENGTKHWVVSTQFELTHARRAFPCFDESYFKATFTVTMVRKNDHIALSNMPLQRTEPRTGEWEADIFERSIRMTPYLVAFTVNQFIYVESYSTDGVRMRVYCRPSFIQYAEYANSISARVLQAFSDWTGIPYAISKLDQVAVPEFAFGAMENWGLVVYRETALLYNPEYTTANQKRYVAYVIAHELAHQWFGNLVTCRWWDDTFLNEAFATYFGYYVGLKAAEPKWEVDEFFIRELQDIMTKDGVHNSQPIRVPELEHHDGLLKAFSRITYTKGGSILRMTRNFLGAATFQAALQKYLLRHQYDTVVNEDLYRALQEQAEADMSITWDAQKTNLSGILASWIDQQNFPLVTASDLGDGSFKVTQSHFLYETDKNISHPTPLGSEFLWDIPLTYTDTTLVPMSTWMLRDQQMRLHGLKQTGWKILNLDEMGFYRVRYGGENWNKIIYQLIQDHTVFTVENRAAFIDDAFQIAKAGQMEEVDALRSTEYLKSETKYPPWYPATQSRIPYYLDMFFSKPAYDDLERYLVNLVLPTYNITGWSIPSDPNILLDRYTRIVMTKTACQMNYKPCVDRAQALFEQFIIDPSINPIHPDLRLNVYCVGVSRGGVREWEFLKDRYEYDYGDDYVAFEKSTIERALACATMPNIIRKYLDYSLDKNSSSLFSTIAVKGAARDTVWNYITEHWDDFMNGNETRISKSDVLTAVTSTWNTEADLRKIQQFKASHGEKDLDKTYTAIEEKILDNMDWVQANMEPIQQWLQAVNSGGTYTQTPPIRRRRRSAATDVMKETDSVYNNHQVATGA